MVSGEWFFASEFAAHYSLLTTHYSLLTTHHSPLTTPPLTIRSGSHAHYRYPRESPPAAPQPAQLELRFFGEAPLDRCGDERREARRAAGRRLRVQLHRPL